MGWTPGAAPRVCSRRAPPHPLSQAGARVTVQHLRSRAFDCSFRSALPLVLCFALSGFHPLRFVFVAGCGGRLWSVFVIWPPGASARPGCLSFLCLQVSAPSVLLLFVLAAAVVFLSFDAGRCCWCSSFGALWLLPALGCLSFGGCVWCLLFGALGFLGLLLALGCLSSSLSGCGLWSVFVLWRSGALPMLKCLFCFLFAGFALLLCLSSSWWLWLAFVLCC